MQENTDGISIGDIFKAIAIKKWLALIIVAVVTVAGTLLIHYVYNGSVRKYETQFTLSMPGEYSGDYYTYLDGSKFYYADMISHDSLSAVKQSDTQFNSVNIDSMVAENAISVHRAVTEKESGDNEIFLSISVSAKYFKSESIARAFLTELANVPIDNQSKAVFDCDAFLSLARQSDGYENMLALMQRQLNYLLKGYSELMKEYGSGFIADGKTLTAYYNELSAYDLGNTISVIGAKIKEDGVLKSEAERNTYKLRKTELIRQLDVAQATLDVLLNSQSQGGSMNIYDATVIKKQSDLVESLKQQVADATKFIEAGVVDESGAFYTEYIDPEYKTLENFTSTYEKTVKSVYGKVSAVTFTQVGVITVTGGMSLGRSVIISLILAVIIALIVAYIFGRIKLKKSRAQSAKVEEPAANSDEQTK